MKTNPKIVGSFKKGAGTDKKFNNKDKPKNNRFFKKFDKHDGAAGGKKWRAPGEAENGRATGGPGRDGKPQIKNGKPFRNNKLSQVTRQGNGVDSHGNKPRGEPGHYQKRQTQPQIWQRPSQDMHSPFTTKPEKYDKRDGAPGGKKWRAPREADNGRAKGAPGRDGKPQFKRGKPFKKNKLSQGMRQRNGAGSNGNEPRGEPVHYQKPQTQQQNWQRPSQELDSLFTTKPEKVDYCRAPERVEAQVRAIKRFDKQDQEVEHQRQQKEKQRKHKMMTMKTKKGQPVMQGRMELLYEKVQKMVGQG